MRYKFLLLSVALLLTATPVLAQKASPIIVETPRNAVPTAVITGQTFKQTYVVRFIDLTHLGEEIIVQKEILEQKFIGEFEVMDFKINYDTKQGEFLEHRWELQYVLRIINPRKGPKIIPGFVVPWKHKKSGQQENDPSIQYNYDLKTDDVHVNYVSTIPEKDTYLGIRDHLDFGSFKLDRFIFLFASWFLAVFPLGLWFIFLTNKFRTSGKVNREEDVKISDFPETVPSGVVMVSKGKAIKNLRKSIRKLKRSRGADVELAVIEVLTAVKDFIRAKAGFNIGATPSEMVKAISDNKNLKSFQAPLLALAERASFYQVCFEGNRKPVVDPIGEVRELTELVGNLRWYKRLFQARS